MVKTGVAFSIANYTFLAIHVFLLLSLMAATTEVAQRSSSLMDLLPLLCSLLIVANCIFNLRIFRRRLKTNTLSNSVSSLYLLSAILFIVSLAFFMIVLGGFIREETRKQPGHSGNEKLLLFICINIAIGLFIFLNQLQLWNSLKKKGFFN